MVFESSVINCIHPNNKEIGSKRLALLALLQTYGIKGISCLSPKLKAMKVTQGSVELTFDNAPKFDKQRLLCNKPTSIILNFKLYILSNYK